MLVARTPPPTSPIHRDYASRDWVVSSSNTASHSPPTHFPAARPSVARRPSALRNASSDHLITPAVTRFATGQPVSIPPVSSVPSDVSSGKDALVPSVSATTPVGVVRPSPVRAGSSPSNLAIDMQPKVPPVVEVNAQPMMSPPSSLEHHGAEMSTSSPGSTPVRPSLSPLGNSATMDGSASSSGSLLARRRSSRSAARADVLPLLSNLSLRGALPSPSLADLDDEVHPTIIGESSHAMTPASEASSPVVAHAPRSDLKKLVETEFRPTRDFVSTPFPGKKQNWIDEDDDEDQLDSPAAGPGSLKKTVVGSRDDAP